MKSKRTYVIAVLLLAVAGLAFLDWRDRAELADLRNVKSTAKDTAALEKKLWDSEQRVRQLEGDLTRARDDLAAANANAKGSQPGLPQMPANIGQNIMQAMQQLINRPEFQRAALSQMKAQVDAQYAAFIRIAGLSPEQGDQMKAAIIARNTAMQDAYAAAQASGLDPRTPEFRDLLNQATSQSNADLRASIGDANYTSFQNYEQTQGQRSTVTALQQQLVQQGAGALLTDTQSEQLVQVLANNSPASANAGAAGGLGQLMAMGTGIPGMAAVPMLGGAATPPLNEAAMGQVQQILNPQQFQAFQQMQQAQQSQQAFLQQMTQAALRGQRGGQQQRGAPQGARRGN